MDKITHQVRCEQWTKIINECLASGMTKTAWCKENGISDKAFFYWQRILREEAYIDRVSSKNELAVPDSSPKELPKPISTFAEIKVTEPITRSEYFKPDMIIKTRNYTFEISNSVSKELLQLMGGILHAE